MRQAAQLGMISLTAAGLCLAALVPGAFSSGAAAQVREPLCRRPSSRRCSSSLSSPAAWNATPAAASASSRSRRRPGVRAGGKKYSKLFPGSRVPVDGRTMVSRRHQGE